MPKKKTYIYALDLSLNSTGICIFTNDGKFIKAFTIDTHAEKETRLKLKVIGDYFTTIMEKYPPEKIIIEQGFYRFNRSTQQLFKVQGIASYIFYKYEQIYYPASTIKKVITGKGNATKKAVKDTILEKYPDVKFENYDQSDAYAVGLTYFINRANEKESNNGKKNI